MFSNRSAFFVPEINYGTFGIRDQFNGFSRCRNPFKIIQVEIVQFILENIHIKLIHDIRKCSLNKLLVYKGTITSA